MDNVEQWDENEQIIEKKTGKRGSQSNLRQYNVTGRTVKKENFFRIRMF